MKNWKVADYLSPIDMNQLRKENDRPTCFVFWWGGGPFVCIFFLYFFLPPFFHAIFLFLSFNDFRFFFVLMKNLNRLMCGRYQSKDTTVFVTYKCEWWTLTTSDRDTDYIPTRIIQLLSPTWPAPTDISTNLGSTYRKYTTTVTSTSRLAHIHVYSYSLYLIPCTWLRPSLSNFYSSDILLKPDGRRSHQLGIRYKRNGPPHRHTYSHRHVPPSMTTRSQHRSAVTPNHPLPLTTSNTARTRGHSQPTDPTYNG
jgi:hypothetical protein